MNETPTFETALAEVEQILRALEDGTTTLEESLARYERGVSLLKICYGHLRSAETRITQLASVDSEGKPITKPFEHAASDGVAAEARTRPTRAKPKGDSGMY